MIPTGFERYVRAEPGDGPFSAIETEVATILARHTSAPDRCWLCLWDGYGYLTGAVFLNVFSSGGPPAPPVRPPKPKLLESRVRLPGRSYLLFTGSVTQAAGWQDGPNLCWPADRRWIVAREIDLDYTLIGGSVDLCAELAGAGAAYVSIDEKN